MSESKMEALDLRVIASHWDELRQPPESALKQIVGGRLKGMTCINPQWRLEVMDRVFGPCGSGWKYTIDKLWTEAGSDCEVLAFALVSVQVCHPDNSWSEPIPGIGGNKLVAIEKGKPHSNDEAFKMAVTDALSVALKALGVASDIYSDLWDGNKYNVRPETIVTTAQLNSLKLKFHEVNALELKGVDRPTMLSRFSAWCLSIVGEQVDYGDANSWAPEWYQACWHHLIGVNSGVDSDVPFDGDE